MRKNSEKLIVAHVIRVRSAAQKPKKLNRRATIIKQLRAIDNSSPMLTSSLAVMITLKITSTKLLEPDADQFTSSDFFFVLLF